MTAVSYIKLGVSIMTVAVNYMLMSILIDLLKSVRYPRKTEEARVTMICIFVSQFVNTAILLPLCYANFSDIDGGDGLFSLVFNIGKYTDFSTYWYATVGSIICKTMFITAIFPPLEFVIFYLLKNVSRWSDRGFGKNSLVTSMPTVQAYIDLYSGCDYSIDYRYATILLNISVAFLFGTAMPYLYLTAFLAFAILYTNERMVICYFARKPPSFDENMTLETLNIIKYVPFVMLPFVFW